MAIHHSVFFFFIFFFQIIFSIIQFVNDEKWSSCLLENMKMYLKCVTKGQPAVRVEREKKNVKKENVERIFSFSYFFFFVLEKEEKRRHAIVGYFR